MRESEHGSARHLRLGAAMFCLGAFATLAQVMFTREMLVAFFGNELVIGTLLASWFIGIGLGSVAVGRMSGRLTDSNRIGRLLALLLVLLAVFLPIQIIGIRSVRLLFQTPAGEYMSLGAVALGSFFLLIPTASCVGCSFPLASRLFSDQPTGETRSESGGVRVGRAVSRLYAWESAGSMAGGAVLTYWLLPRWSSGSIMAGMILIALVGATLAMPRVRLRWLLMGGLIVLSGWIGLCSDALRPAEKWLDHRRWESFGVLPRNRDLAQEQTGAPEMRLVESVDSIYQNLAVMESDGQYTLYANGQVLMVFPDPISDEHRVHFIMAQNPAARRILLLGGNSVGIIPELLKYPVEQVVDVEIDPRVGRVLHDVLGPPYDAVPGDRRVKHAVDDASRFVRRCPDRFDIVWIAAPEPSTMAASRYYTAEFYADVKRLLTDNGFLCTAVSSSERLEAESVNPAASVYQTLKTVFPVVRVTAGTPTVFLAGGPSSGLTLDRDRLYEKSLNAHVATRYFRPEYFRGADEISPDKIGFFEKRFASARVPINTRAKPVTFFYQLMLWSRFSGSGVRAWLSAAKFLSASGIAMALMGGGLLAVAIGLCRRERRRAAGEGGGAWTRWMVGVVVGTTGFCGIAMEIALMFVFQSLYGYVYAQMGLMVALFMLGLVLGAVSGRRMSSGVAERCWGALTRVEALWLVLALALPFLLRWGAAGEGWGGAALIYAALTVAGWALGAEYPISNRLYTDAGGIADAAVANLNASDHWGAAAGCLVMGVALVPILGIEGACLALASVKVAALCFLFSAFLTRPKMAENISTPSP